MPDCTLGYIPARLLQTNRLAIKQFGIGEFLYRRCNIGELENPFKSISLTELSHNRGGMDNNNLCEPDDVLFSIIEDEEFEKYNNKVVCTLTIISLTDENNYLKTFTQENEHCEMILIHEPEKCMYPHSVFRITINGIRITYDNYSTTLQRLHKIRNQLREELASMIIRKQVRQDEVPTNN